MPTTRMTNPSAARRTAPARPAPIVAVLPTQPTVASHDPNDFHIMIHGEVKIGKSTLLTVEENVLVLSFDPIRKSHEVMQVHLPSWNHFIAYLNELEKASLSGKFPYTRVVVDGCDIWYRLCQAWSCRMLGVQHPNDAEYGKGWDMLKETFATAVDRILALPCGVWFISHSQWKQKMTRGGGKDIEKLHPLMKDGGYELLVGKLDGAFAYDYYNRERVLILLGDEITTAGHTIKNHFLTPDGRPIAEVPMGNTEEEAWNNFMAAFNNEQTFASLKERDDAAAPRRGATPARRR